MAKLTFTGRPIRMAPDVLGNRESEEPFEVDVRRLTTAELAGFQGAAAELRGRLYEGVTEDEVAALFDGVLSGPTGKLEIDGEACTDLRPLFRLATIDPPFQGCIFDGLAQAVVVTNGIAETQAKNSERRRGGSGGTEATATAAFPPPSAADDAASSSSTGSTSSAPMAEAESA